MKLNIKAEDAFELIKTRRSCRNFTEKPVEDNKLDLVLRAGQYAPSGGNNQNATILAITNRDILNALENIVREEFSKMEVRVGMYKSIRQSIFKSKADESYIYDYSAPALIVVGNKPDYPNNLADTACILENMMIMANALDLGACWINQLRWLNENEVIRQCMQDLNMPEDSLVYGALVLGYPDTEDGMPVRSVTERTGNMIYYIK